jgi:hypothetical protein
MFGQKMSTNNMSDFAKKKNGNKSTFGTKGYNSKPASVASTVINGPNKPALQK